MLNRLALRRCEYVLTTYSQRIQNRSMDRRSALIGALTVIHIITFLIMSYFLYLDRSWLLAVLGINYAVSSFLYQLRSRQ